MDAEKFAARKKELEILIFSYEVEVHKLSYKLSTMLEKSIGRDDTLAKLTYYRKLLLKAYFELMVCGVSDKGELQFRADCPINDVCTLAYSKHSSNSSEAIRDLFNMINFVEV